MLTEILKKCVRGKFLPWHNQARTVRPSIQVSDEKFELHLDVHQFKKDELRVKVAPDYLIIEGKHERKTDKGFIIRQFFRKFRLPDGCNPNTVESRLSPKGVLTICAPRSVCHQSIQCERLVPVKSSHLTPKETFIKKEADAANKEENKDNKDDCKKMLK